MQSPRPGTDALDPFIGKLQADRASVAVAGLGYVGLPMAVCCAETFPKVVGIDVDPSRVEAVNRGSSYIDDLPDARLARCVQEGALSATDDYGAVRDSDVVLICVPTPLRKTGEPDVSFIVQSVDAVEEQMGPGKLIVLESTTYPGTTDELVCPRLERNGMEVGRDFWLAFSPERIDPGPAHPEFDIPDVPKVVGGVTPSCTRAAAEFYARFIEEVLPVSGSKVAEMVKLLENTYRGVNVAMVNELALMCDKLGVDVWEVVDAAATKPYGFQAFYPGPGLGGHCIPVDPFYLAWKARLHGFEPRFIDLAGRVNASMPEYVVRRVADILNDAEKALRGSTVHVLGVAYKRDVSDVRESPALTIIDLLRAKGAEVSYTDPHVPRIRPGEAEALGSIPLEQCDLASFDCVLIVTDHSAFPWERVAGEAGAVLDTRNALRDCDGDHIHKL